MYTNSLSRNHQKLLRAVVVFAAEDYNIHEPTPIHEPIAFMGTVGLSDGTCPPATGRSCGNHPVRWITFDGVHDDYPKDAGQSATWMPAQTWSFINQL